MKESTRLAPFYAWLRWSWPAEIGLETIRAFLTRPLDPSIIDETEGEFSDRFLQNLAAESIPEIDGRHVARWGRYIRHLPHYKFRVDGRRNPFIEQCRNGSIGYVTRR